MAITSHPEGRIADHAASSLLLRRLMIQCPSTGLPTDTGFELTEIPRLARTRQVLVDCLECGQDHEWRLEDAFLH